MQTSVSRANSLHIGSVDLQLAKLHLGNLNQTSPKPVNATDGHSASTPASQPSAAPALQPARQLVLGDVSRQLQTSSQKKGLGNCNRPLWNFSLGTLPSEPSLWNFRFETCVCVVSAPALSLVTFDWDTLVGSVETTLRLGTSA